MLVTKFLYRVQDVGLYHQQYSNLQVEIMSKLKGTSRETKKTFEEGAGQTIETKICMLRRSSYKMEKDIEMIRSVVSKCVDMLEKVMDGKLDAKDYMQKVTTFIRSISSKYDGDEKQKMIRKIIDDEEEYKYQKLSNVLMSRLDTNLMEQKAPGDHECWDVFEDNHELGALVMQMQGDAITERKLKIITYFQGLFSAFCLQNLEYLSGKDAVPREIANQVDAYVVEDEESVSKNNRAQFSGQHISAARNGTLSSVLYIMDFPHKKIQHQMKVVLVSLKT